VIQEGKEVVRWNATRHGISSPAPVVPGLEKKEDWQEHREGILESLSRSGTWSSPSRSAWRPACVPSGLLAGAQLHRGGFLEGQEDLAQGRGPTARKLWWRSSTGC
jgi:hypothetical protein